MSLFNNNHFYHETILRFFTAFGDAFSGITIVKKDINGNKQQVYEVPIEYAPKHKWLTRIREQNDLTKQQVKMTLPRIAFEMVDIRYSPNRKIGVNGNFAFGSTTDGLRGRIYPPVPYDVILNMYVLTKDQGDSLQIVEQILPYFQPYMTVTYEVLPEYQVSKDVPITLTGIATEDAFEGSPEDVRTINQTFTFNAQMDFFGPTYATSNIIKDVIINMGYTYSKPTTTTLEVRVEPITANVTDSYSLIETKTELI